MSAPNLMFEHALNAIKGWFDMSSLDFTAKMSANVTFDVPAGRVAHVNQAGEYEMGVGETDMPIFLRNGSDDLDVSNPGITPSGAFMHQAIAPIGGMTGLVATGGYELETTEFDTARTYLNGQLLTAGNSNTVLATGGVLTNAGTGSAGDVKQYVDPVCGVVSRGKYKNEHEVYVLAFWSCYLPGAYV